MLKKIFFLNHFINIFLNAKKNILVLKYINFKKYFFLSSKYFFFINEKKTKIFFDKKKIFNSFLSHFKKIYSEFFSIYFSKFKLRGLGYRLKFISKRLFRIFIGTTNYFYLHIPFTIFFKIKRRRMLLFSFSLSDLKIFSINIESLKKIIPYRLRGFFFPKQIILMKPGKKRF